MAAIGDSLIGLSSSDDGEDEKDEDNEETKQGKWSEDKEHGWVMSTIVKTVLQHMPRFRQKLMNHDELLQPG
jgi:hypothetical protein